MKTIETRNYGAKSNSSGGKIYQLQIVEVGNDEYEVRYEHGARYGNQRTGLKTPKPVSLFEAKAVLESEHALRLKKDYKPEGTSTSTSTSTSAPTNTAPTPEPIKVAPTTTSVNRSFTQPLFQIYVDQKEEKIKDKNFAMQQKHDGERRVVDADLGEVKGYGRYEREKPLTDDIIQSFLGKSITVDCEAVGKKLYVFDILSVDKKNLREKSFKARYKILEEVIAKIDNPNIILVEAFFTMTAKRKAYKALEDQNAEGVVFKDIRSKYVAATDATQSAGQFKLKFYASASFLVLGHTTGKSSVELGVSTPDFKIRSVGKVTIPPNTQMPNVGAVVDCRYLYAYPGGGLAQPTFERVRGDVLPEHCSEERLQFKTEAAA